MAVIQYEYLLNGVNYELARRVRLAAQLAGIPIRLWFGYRSYAQQTATWQNQANNPNPVAPPGFSPHEWGAAVDMTPVTQTAVNWNRLWNAGTRAGLILGRYFTPTDPSHFELPGFIHRSATQPGLRQYGIYSKPGAVAAQPVVWSLW